MSRIFKHRRSPSQKSPPKLPLVMTDSPHVPLKMAKPFQLYEMSLLPSNTIWVWWWQDFNLRTFRITDSHWTVLRISSSLRAGEQLYITFSDNIWTSRWFHRMYTKGEFPYIEIPRLLYLWVHARTEHLVEYRNSDIRWVVKDHILLTVTKTSLMLSTTRSKRQ